MFHLGAKKKKKLCTCIVCWVCIHIKIWYSTLLIFRSWIMHHSVSLKLTCGSCSWRTVSITGAKLTTRSRQTDKHPQTRRFHLPSASLSSISVYTDIFRWHSDQCDVARVPNSRNTRLEQECDKDECLREEAPARSWREGVRGPDRQKTRKVGTTISTVMQLFWVIHKLRHNGHCWCGVWTSCLQIQGK